MLRELGLAAALALFAHSAEAQELATWHGEAFAENPSPGCTSGSDSAGSTWLITYSPAGLADNGSQSFAAAVSFLKGASMRVEGGFAQGMTYDLLGVTARGPRVGGTAVGTILLWNQKPAVGDLTVDDRNVIITARVSNFGGTPGCALTLRGYLTKRP